MTTLFLFLLISVAAAVAFHHQRPATRRHQPITVRARRRWYRISHRRR